MIEGFVTRSPDLVVCDRLAHPLRAHVEVPMCVNPRPAPTIVLIFCQTCGGSGVVLNTGDTDELDFPCRACSGTGHTPEYQELREVLRDEWIEAALALIDATLPSTERGQAATAVDAILRRLEQA